jgi:hypothetical protein
VSLRAPQRANACDCDFNHRLTLLWQSANASIA